MKKQNGVTMIELVIVLIIILLITTFSVYTGSNSVDQAMVTEVYSEMNSMREAVNGVVLKKELDESFIVQEGKNYDFKISTLATSVEEFENAYGIDIVDEEFNYLYIIVGMDDFPNYENSKVRDFYGFSSIKHSYLVNFDEGKVDLLKPLKLVNREVRTFEQVRALVDEGEV